MHFCQGVYEKRGESSKASFREHLDEINTIPRIYPVKVESGIDVVELDVLEELEDVELEVLVEELEVEAVDAGLVHSSWLLALSINISRIRRKMRNFRSILLISAKQMRTSEEKHGYCKYLNTLSSSTQRLMCSFLLHCDSKGFRLFCF